MLGLGIQGGAGFDVMRDIGNRHNQTKTLALAFAIYRIVKVTCVFAIDGDQGQLRQVFATALVLITHEFSVLGGFRLHLRRPDLR